MLARSFAPLVLAALLTGALPPQSVPAPPLTGNPAILLVAGDDPGQPYVQEVYEGFREVLDAKAPNAILFREFFDVVRFGDRPSYASEFRRWLFEKYRDQPVNVLVATQQLTLDLLAPDDENPWRGVPLVYGTFGDPAVDLGATYPTASGIEAEHPFPQSLGLITSILPGTKRIAVVGGASRAERTRNARYASDVRRAGLDFLDLGDLTLDALVERVGTLAADTVPILVGFQVDAAGRTFQSEEALARIVRATSRPLFTLNSADLGNGVVGGLVFGGRLVGRELAAAALARLDGQPPSRTSIPVAVHARALFDAGELARWGITESRLPAGSTVLFRPGSLWRDYRRTVIAAVAFGTLQTLLILAILMQRRHRARVQVALAASYTQLRQLTNRLISAQEEERSRIARNLHDDVGQRVASLSIALSALRRKPDTADTVRQELSALQQQTVALSGELRDLSHELHPGILEHLGLVEALRSRCEELENEAGVRVRLDVADDWPKVSDAVALCLYRVVQEALRNVHRHAAAQNVVVSLSRDGADVLLHITDDGRGFDTGSPQQGLGLVSLAERVTLLGGTFSISSFGGAGTTLDVRLPTEVSRAA
jgi:signal transduction histidine kinase